MSANKQSLHVTAMQPAPIRRAATHARVTQVLKETVQRAPISMIVNRTLVTVKGSVRMDSTVLHATVTLATLDQRVALFSTHVLRMAFKDRKA